MFKCFRSLGIERNEFYDKYWLGDCLKKKQSIAAMKDGEILALQIEVDPFQIVHNHISAICSKSVIVLFRHM